MEHRHGERVPMNLPAVVHTDRGKHLAAIIGNLSCGGAFLYMPAKRVRLRGLIEVEFCLPDGDSQRWRAFVVQQQADGVGVMFDNLELEELLPLLAWARAMQRSRAATAVAA
ncbi:MAG: PilZ domain-containing protein [Gammaproteobacteria bacterium]|nr:PilZ domain-containing protein [Gammaproteobacteria bacterium]MDH5276201.1 PilZ domain-containing protein [Gammaproteobacteria bacterium]